MRAARFFEALSKLGLSYDESNTLRLAEKTLSRWSGLECGDGNSYGSWAIERDETTGKPFMIHHHYLHGRGTDYTTRHAIADREVGALKRAQAILDARNARLGGNAGKSWGNYLVMFHQTDPRGCALYLLKRSDIPAGTNIDSIYNRGLAVCA